MRLLLILCCFSLLSCQSITKYRKFEVRNTRTTYIPLKLQNKNRVSNTAPPHITDRYIIAGNAYDGVSAYERSNGQKKWTKPIEGGVESGFIHKGNRLYFGGNDYRFYAVNVHSGVEIWTVDIEGEVLSEPVLSNGRIYFLTSTNNLYALNAKDGKQVWRYKRNIEQAFTVRGASTPVISKDRLYIGFSDGYFVSLRINDGSLLWERAINQNPKFKDVDAKAYIDGDTIYISGFDASLYALSIHNGQILWSLDQGGVYSVTSKDNQLLYPTTDGKLLLLDKSSGKLIRSWTAKGTFRKPYITNNYLIIGDSSGPILFIDTLTWKTLGSFHPGIGLSSPITAKDDKHILFLTEGANLVELEYQWSDRRAF